MPAAGSGHERCSVLSDNHDNNKAVDNNQHDNNEAVNNDSRCFSIDCSAKPDATGNTTGFFFDSSSLR